MPNEPVSDADDYSATEREREEQLAAVFGQDVQHWRRGVFDRKPISDWVIQSVLENVEHMGTLLCELPRDALVAVVMSQRQRIHEQSVLRQDRYNHAYSSESLKPGIAGLGQPVGINLHQQIAEYTAAQMAQLDTRNIAENRRKMQELAEQFGNQLPPT